jgi:hypothetical protein
MDCLESIQGKERFLENVLILCGHSPQFVTISETFQFSLISVQVLTTMTGKLKVSELLFEVPRDYSNPERGTLQLFGRSVTKYEKAAAPLSNEENRKRSYKPWMVYLQGGPGFGCQPPQDSPMTNVILEKGYQMLYLDNRGTGLSTPISAATLALQGDVHRQADYLKLFRADSIVCIFSSFSPLT